MSDVFISYSRANIDFARNLFKSLHNRNYEVWIDLEGIRFTADWWEEIKRGIENTRNFVLVMSSNSLSSPVCHLEIEYARKSNKRIILLNHQAVDKSTSSRAMLDRLASDAYVNTLLGDRNPMKLFDDNWYIIDKFQRVNFPDDDQFDAHFENLHTALQTDLDHVNFHTRMVRRALDWERNEQNDSYLLFGDELKQAENWLVGYDADATIRKGKGDMPKIPAPTDAQRGYIAKSRVVENRRNLRLRVGAIAGVLAVVGVIFAIVATLIGVNATNTASQAESRVADANLQLTTVADQVNVANLQLTQVAQQVTEGEARIESLRLANIATGIIGDSSGNTEIASLLAIRSLNLTYTSQADDALSNALQILYGRQILNGHDDWVLGVAWSPDGLRLASASRDNTIRIWDTQTGSEKHLLTGHTDTVRDVAWSPDGLHLASASVDNTIRLWDMQTMAMIMELIGHTDSVISVAWSHDGTRLVSSSLDETVRIWNAQTGDEIRVLTGHTDDINQVAWSYDDTRLASASDDGTARIWDAETGDEMLVLTGNLGSIYTIAWSPYDRIATGSANGTTDGTVSIWNSQTGERLQTIIANPNESFNMVEKVIWSPDGHFVASASSDGFVRIWDIEKGIPLRVFGWHQDTVYSIAWSLDGTRIASVSGDGPIRIWDAQMYPKSNTLTHPNVVDTIAWSPDGTRLATSTLDYNVYIWDVPTQTRLYDLRGHTNQIIGLAWSPDNQWLASASEDATIRLWDAQTGELIHIFTGHDDDVFSVAWSPDGTKIVTGGLDKTIRIWDVQTGEQVHVLMGHTSWVNDVAWSPDGQYIVSGAESESIRLWDAQTGEALQAVNQDDYRAIRRVAWSADSQFIAFESHNNDVTIWDRQAWQAIQIFDDTTSYMAWSPDGRRMALVDLLNDIIRFRDVLTGEEMRSIELEFAYQTEWSPDNITLATVVERRDVYLWQYPNPEYACTRVFRDLTLEERELYDIRDETGAIDLSPTCPQFADVTP